MNIRAGTLSFLMGCFLWAGPFGALKAQQEPGTSAPPPPPPQRDYTRTDNAAMDYDPNKANLTDEEWRTSKTFFHEGKAQRELKQKCSTSGDTEKACEGMDAASDYKFVAMAAKAYALIMGMAPGKFSKTDEAYKADHAKDPNNAKKDVEDYCKYIAMATEAIALIQQTTAQSNLATTINAEHKQLEQLEKAKLSHEERAKTARIQAIGWTASSVCYAGYMVMPGINATQPMLILKLAATGLFAYFSWKQVKAHEDYADRIAQIIAEFETRKGNCNPVTQRDCYCAQPESENDPKYCMPQLHQRAIAKGALRVSCVDKKLQADPKCSCMSSNSCFDTAWYSMTNGMNFGQSAESNNRFIKDISRGELTGGGRLNSAAMGQHARRQLRSLRGFLEKAPVGNASKEAMEDAKIAAAEADLPLAAALALAALPMNPDAQRQLAALKANAAKTAASLADVEKASGGARGATYWGGEGTQRAKKSGGPGVDLAALGKLKKDGPKNNSMNWAENAEKAAQITQRSDRDLFEIITRRYQVTGRRRLEIAD